MSTYKLAGQEISPKTLQYSIGKSARIITFHHAAFHAEVLPRLRKLMLSFYREAMQTQDLELRMKLGKSFTDMVELRRQLLGFPSPGRRKDATEVRAPPTIHDAPTVVEATPSTPPEPPK